MKQGILLNGIGNSGWIGGLYYIKNVAFQLSINEKIREKYDIYIWLEDDENLSIFNDLPEVVHVIKSLFSKDIMGKLYRPIVYKKYNIKIVYPTFRVLSFPIQKILGIKTISWIADFQHNRMPNMFDNKEINNRNQNYQNLANAKVPLVLSSKDAENDLRKFYSATKRDVYVMSFVSYIVPEIRKLTVETEYVILKKFGIESGRYVLISNQFWMHKNHIVVLQSIQVLVEKYPEVDIKFVFTGMPKDYRNPDYYNKLMELIESDGIKDRICMLGFIERMEQLAIMKNSKFIIQPSLFEGWGTVVEDAKVLDKKMLLSDIPLHHEQMNEKCVLFDPYDPIDLADKIIEMEKMLCVDDVDKGIDNMYLRAREYSDSFWHLLEDLKNN